MFGILGTVFSRPLSPTAKDTVGALRLAAVPYCREKNLSCEFPKWFLWSDLLLMRSVIFLIPIVLYLLMAVREGSWRRRFVWLLPFVLLVVLVALLMILMLSLNGGGMVNLIYGSALMVIFTGPIIVVYLLILILLALKLGRGVSQLLAKRNGSSFGRLPGNEKIWFLLTIVICFFVAKLVWNFLLCATSGGYPTNGGFKIIPVASWTGCFKFIKIF